MKNNINVLVSNVALPSKVIGSWTTRLTKFIYNTDFFDYILSPSNENKKNIFCKKNKFITYNKRIRKIQLKKWVAKDFYNSVLKLSNETKNLTIVVIDDTHLLELFAVNKSFFSCKIKLIFSFHGFSLSLKDNILFNVDKILFQTTASYLASKDNFFSFTPEVKIIGNGVDSSTFFLLNNSQKKAQKKELGFKSNETIITWVANGRPSKGIHIFLKAANVILKKYENIKIVVIGSRKDLGNKYILNIGRIPNNEISKYLQVSDYFFFTTLCKEGFALSPIEALKCGNNIISTNIGSVPESLKGLKNVLFVDKPNIVSEWVNAFDISMRQTKELVTKEELDLIHNYENWELNFKNSIL